MQILLPLLQLKKEQRKRLDGILKLPIAHMPGIVLALYHIFLEFLIFLFKLILMGNIFIFSAMFSTNYKGATDFLIRPQYSEAIFYVGFFCFWGVFF